MNLQVLVSAMHQADHSILEKMNIQSDAVIINQCDRNEVEEFNYRGNKVSFLSFAERGVGLSRNNALMRATSDISIFADDDVTYVDNYKETVIKAYKAQPEADVILFNVPSKNPERPTYTINKKGRVRWFNCLRYGAVKITARTAKLKRENIYFSLLFGGGARYGSGEDSMFLADCIRKGLKVYARSEIIGYVNQESSSWFEGYTDKYFIDMGAFFACFSKGWAGIMCLQLLMRHPEIYGDGVTLQNAFKLMLRGIKEFNGR